MNKFANCWENEAVSYMGNQGHDYQNVRTSVRNTLLMLKPLQSKSI